MHRRAAKLGQYGLAGGGLALGSLKLYDPQLELSPIGAIRFGRCALAATSIAIDYKWNLYITDSQCKEYDEVLSRVISLFNLFLIDKTLVLSL